MSRDEQRAKDAYKAETWLKYIDAGRRAKRDYNRVAKETLAMFKANHDDFYQRIHGRWIDFKTSGVTVSVNKPAQIRSVLGAHLYQRNPSRTVNCKTTDTVFCALADIEEKVLNYTPGECNLEEQIRKAIDDALLRGRGFLRTGFDQDRGVITSWAISSTRVVIDPAAESFEDANWIAIKTCAPVWVVKRRFGKPDKWRVRDLTGNMTALTRDDDEQDEEKDHRARIEEATEGSYLSDLVEYWEVYSKMGSGLVRGPEASSNYKGEDDSKDFVKIVVSRDHPIPLYEGEWDVPLYLDKEWPLVKLDLIDCVDELWPQSIFGQANSYAKVIDLCSSLRLEACKNDARKVILLHPEAFQAGEEQRVCYGRPTEVIRINSLPPGQTLEQVAKVLELGVMSPEVADERAWAEQGFETQTGVVSILHGGAEAGSQDRSATASNLKSQAANARLNDMLAKVEGFCSRTARNEGILIRLGGYMSEDDVAKVCGEAELGYVVSVMGNGVEMPLRLEITKEEENMLAQRGESQPLTIKELLPEAAEYFATEEEAGMAAQLIEQSMAQRYLAGDMRLADYMDISAAAQDPMAGMGGPQLPQFNVSIRKVDVPTVFRDTTGLSPRDVSREFSFGIEAGTTQRMDPQTKRELAETLMGQVMPKAMEIGAFDWVNDVLGKVYDAWGLPKNERPIPLSMPLPPAPMPGQPPMEGGMPGEAPPEEAPPGA